MKIRYANPKVELEETPGTIKTVNESIMIEDATAETVYELAKKFDNGGFEVEVNFKLKEVN